MEGDCALRGAQSPFFSFITLGGSDRVETANPQEILGIPGSYFSRPGWTALDESGKINLIMGSSLKRVSVKESAGWAERQAEIIVDTFLSDGAPEDLLRLEQAIADALRRAHDRGQRLQPLDKRLQGPRSGRPKKT